MAQLSSNARRTDRLVPRTAIARLAHRAGALQISSLVPAEVFGIGTKFLEGVVSAAQTVTRYRNRKTVSAEDVLQALAARGQKLYSTGEERTMKRCKIFPGALGSRRTRAERRIRFEQKQSECYTISRAAFQRMLRTVATRMDRLRWNADAAALVHVAMESHLIQHLRSAVMMASHVGRATVLPKDLQVSRYMRKQWAA